MKITIKDLVFLLLIVLSFYLNRRPVEKLVNISKDSAGNYIIPGNLKIKGGLNVTKITAETSIYSAGTIQAEKGLYGGFLTVVKSSN